MKLKYHKKVKDTHGKTHGLLILEAEPQMRNLFRYGQTSCIARVPMPYVQFVLHYRKINDKFVYDGLGGNGLRVYGSLDSLDSFKNNIFGLPTDPAGLVCTDHKFDNKRFNSLFELAQSIITLWYNTMHYADGKLMKKWESLDLSNLKKMSWVKNNYNFRNTELRVVLKRFNKVTIPINARIQKDKNWTKENAIKISS